ncbi:hypothetical protein VTK26DRAFT_5924 [Humicola hyalothermophila]
MMLSEYEARRKQQNREAQRRYRNRRKEDRSGLTQKPEQCFGEKHISVASPSSSSRASTHEHRVAAMSSSADVDFPGLESNVDELGGFFLNGDFPADFSYPGTSMTDNLLHQSPASYQGSHMSDGMDPFAERQHVGIASNFCAKADGLIDDLERLYEFGVDMEIIAPLAALVDNLTMTRALFRESAAGRRKRYPSLS